MRVTSKGQVTIPLEVRRALGIESGSEVDFVREATGSYRLVRLDGPPPENPFRAARGVAKGGMSTDEILALTRERP